MVKIVKIELTNFRSYYNKYTIEIPDGKNLLIYGENGSGKSSFYEALKQFYNASDATQNAKLSRNLAVPQFYENEQGGETQSEVSVRITYKDSHGNTNEFIFGVPGGNVVGDQTISSYRQQSIFLSYRELLSTHLINDPYDTFEFQTKFANLIITKILAFKINSGTNKSYLRNWEELWVRGKGSRPGRLEKESILKNFDAGLKADISEINFYLSEILLYFDKNLHVELDVKDSYIEYEEQNYPVFQIGLDGKFFNLNLNEEEESHLSILNEARLSALAISVFFAGIIATSNENIPQKMIFLDDIFIGLDMSNRLPLLKILSEYRKPEFEDILDELTGKIKRTYKKDENQNNIYEATPFFNGYQIFLTTYDKHWFEVAKPFLSESRWNFLEMYAHQLELNDDQKLEVPLIQNSIDNYEKALFYFKRNKDFKDYPAAANYLRKVVEGQLKRVLYDKYLLKNGSKGTIILREELEDLRQSFQKLLEDLGYAEIFPDFSIVAKTVLNPLSHENLQKPIYKRELEDAFELVRRLQQIKKQSWFEKGITLFMKTTKDGVERITNLEIAREVLLYEIAGNKRHTPIELQPVNFLEGEVLTKLSSLPVCSLEKAFDQIHHHVFGTRNASNGSDVKQFFLLNENQSLRDKFNEAGFME